MNQKYVFTMALLLSSLAYSQKGLSNSCIEKASYKIIEKMELEEPKADIHLVKDKSGAVIGLTDSAEIYSSYDLTEVSIESSTAQVIFHSGDAISFAVVKIGKTKKECKIVSVDMGQDDHD